MTYQYRERLKKGGDRFAQVNTTTISYQCYEGGVVEELEASMVLQSPQTVDPEGALVRTERQQFTLNIRDLVDGTRYFLPYMGDIIWTSNTEKYEVIRESENSPMFKYVTADRSIDHARIIITTQRMAR